MSKRADSISITNHTSKTIEIGVLSDTSVAPEERKKFFRVGPKDSFVFFTDRVEAITWVKEK